MKKKGFTIIEIIISVALISVVMLFLFQLLTDVEFEATHPTYAKENQVVRASVMRSVQQDLSNMPLKSIDSTNKQRIKFIYQDGTTPLEKVLTISDSAISYGSEEAWELQGQDVKIDTDNIQVKIVGNDPSLCTDIQNQELQITEQHCPNYQYVKIVIPITNGNEDNVIDDIELFYIGEATVFEPDQSLRTYFLKFKNDPGSTIQVNRISTTQSAIASTGDINESNEIYPGDQLRITILPKTNYDIDSYSVEGYPEFRSGETIEVKQNVIIESKSHVPEYSLKVENQLGTNIVINRTFSEVGGTGVIHQGDKIYQGDKLLISVTTNTSAYNTPTLKANGATIASGTEYTVNRPNENQLVVSSSATVREYTLTKNQGDGTTLTIQRTSSPIGKGITGVLENNAKIYYNDVLKVTVSASQGYKDAKITAGGSALGNGGTKTVTGNLTISSSASYATYSLSYNLDGGAYGTNHPTTASYNTPFTVNNPTKTGHTFTGWNITGMDSVTHTYGSSTTTNASINGTKETTFKNLRASAGTVTFKANWNINTYTVKWDGNGGTVTKNGATSVKYNNAVGTLGTATRTGHTFDGWYTAKTGGTKITKNTKVTGNVTYYAHWNPNTYTVTYNANKGAGAPDAQTKYYGTDLKLSSSKPTRRGYTFVNWNTKSNGSGTSYSAGGKYTDNAKVTLYAQWNKADTIKPEITCVDPTSIRGGSITFSRNTNFSYTDNGGSDNIKSVEYKTIDVTSWTSFPGSISTRSAYVYIKVTDYSDNYANKICFTGVDNVIPYTPELGEDETLAHSNVTKVECSKNDYTKNADNECTIYIKNSRVFEYRFHYGDDSDYYDCSDPDYAHGCAGVKELREDIYDSSGRLLKHQTALFGHDFRHYDGGANHKREITVVDNAGNVSRKLILHIVSQ